jgi:hypothetical protein
MLRKTIGALAIAVMAAVGLAQAQTSATLVLRSGDRVQGDLVDMNSSAFTMRVSGQERKVPVDDVSVVEFSGGGSVSDADWNRVSGDKHIAWLRNGQTVEGRLYDVAGTSPKKLLFKTDSGERELSSNEVSRIALARPSSGSAGTSGSSGAPEGEGVAVDGNQQWTPTGMTVRRGEVLTFNATGEVRLSADSNDVAAPAGSRSGRYAQNAPLPKNFAGALIARVGNNGEPFPIGNETRVTMPANGQLFLGINDDAVGDNAGGFRVQITRASRR